MTSQMSRGIYSAADLMSKREPNRGRDVVSESRLRSQKMPRSALGCSDHYCMLELTVQANSRM